MKKFFKWVLITLFPFMLVSSCASTAFYSKIRVFVDSVEFRYTNNALTQEEWVREQAAYDLLCEEFKQKEPIMSKREIRKVKKEMKRFDGIAEQIEKNGLPTVGEAVGII